MCVLVGLPKMHVKMRVVRAKPKSILLTNVHADLHAKYRSLATCKAYVCMHTFIFNSHLVGLFQYI